MFVAEDGKREFYWNGLRKLENVCKTALGKEALTDSERSIIEEEILPYIHEIRDGLLESRYSNMKNAVQSGYFSALCYSDVQERHPNINFFELRDIFVDMGAERMK